MKSAALIFLLMFLTNCAQVTSLNLKKHQFGRIPTKIIWMQIAGLSPEHIAFLKFSNNAGNEMTSFEKSICTGSMWNYDLYNLRPSSELGFLSQMTGKKDLKNNCSDYRHKPIWKYLSSKNYKIGIFETVSKNSQSLVKSKSCKEGEDYLDEAITWRMASKEVKNLFHINERKQYKVGRVYHDKSCLSGSCYTSISRNIEVTYNSFQKNTKNYLYIVRNFSYQNLLKKNRIKKAKEELMELSSTLNYFQNLARKNTDMLVIVTSADAVDLNLPKAGKQWASYEKNAKYVRRTNSNLISPVYAFGARAENFCGTFEQSQILKRIFSGAKQQGLEFSIINPFE